MVRNFLSGSGSAERNGSPVRRPETCMQPEGALGDITVLDLSHALAGPLCSTLLGDFGARVIKLETPGGGDIARKWGPPFHGDDSAYFVGLNRNKKSVEIDLKHPKGKELFFRLLDRADVL